VPEATHRIETIDCHAAGEPLRIVTSGYPEVPGDTILAKRRHAAEHLDDLRTALMWEPRGHADMYGCVLTNPVTPDGDVGVLFMHNEGYSTMCGHGIIGLVTAGLEYDLFQPRDEQAIRIDTPAGRVTARPDRDDDRVRSVSFRNVPSFACVRGRSVDVPGLGPVVTDLAFGGAFYAYVDARELGVQLVRENASQVIEVGRRIKQAVMEAIPIVHPAGQSDLDFLYGTILVEGGTGGRSRNACVFADGELDRSPTGTGVSGRAALHHARGELALGESLVIESILGTSFDVRVHAETTVAGHPAIVPEVTGSAWVTGRHEFLVSPADPLAGGFLLGR